MMKEVYKSKFKSETDLFPKIRIAQVKLLPIKFSEDQPSFTRLVDQIIEMKSQGKDTTELENKIDVMVYKLYEMTHEEVKIIDPEFWMSEGEYEKFKT